MIPDDVLFSVACRKITVTWSTHWNQSKLKIKREGAIERQGCEGERDGDRKGEGDGLIRREGVGETESS